MTDAEVLIVDAGPTGLMLAGELALAGIDVAILERRAGAGLAGSRAGGLHSRTIEVLDQRGIAGRFLAEGRTAQVAQFAGIPLDIGDCPTRHNYVLALWQTHVERILAGWVGELGVPIHRGCEANGLRRTMPRSASHSAMAAGCGLSISSAATADAASFERQPASIFPGRSRPSAT